MEEILDELYHIECESGRFSEEQDLEYVKEQDEFDQYLDSVDKQTADKLTLSAYAMVDRGNQLAFRHSLRLGLRLALWAERSDPTTAPACPASPEPGGISPRFCSASPSLGGPGEESDQN